MGAIQQAGITCGPNFFVYVLNVTAMCRPCPPNSYLNETQHNFTMCNPTTRVEDDGRFWNFQAGEINPYVFLVSILFFLALIVAFACLCWRQAKRQISEYNKTTIVIQDDVQDKTSKSQVVLEKLLQEGTNKSSIRQETRQCHKIKSFLKFFKNTRHHEEEHRAWIQIKSFQENV